MSEPKPKTDTIHIRVSPDTKQQFTEAASHFKMQPSELLRELVIGFVEGRVTIAPPPDMETLYNARNPNC